MSEQLGYIKALDGSPLYAAYHAPQGREQKTELPVVIAPPLFEERKSAYATLRRLAVELAAEGHPVMRFDYRGSGESGGQSGTRRWEHLAQDVATVRKTLASLAGKRDSALVGLRLGATLALQETGRVGGECVVALAPIIAGATQVRMWKMRSKIRSELTDDVQSDVSSSQQQPSQVDEDIFDFDGYDVHPGFFEDLAKVNLSKDLGALSCPGLILQLSHRTDAAPESTQLMSTLGSKARLECLRIEPFWDKLDDVDTGPMIERVVDVLGER